MQTHAEIKARKARYYLANKERIRAQQKDGNKKYYAAHKARVLAAGKARYHKTKEQQRARAAQYYDAHKEKKSAYSALRYQEHKQKYKQRIRAYYEKNREAYSLDRKLNPEEYSREGKERRAKNRERINAVSRANRRRRREKDKAYAVSVNLRRRLSKYVRRGRGTSIRRLRLCGCAVTELRQHLEKQFQPGMTWENYGQWHVDHIRPCASYDLTQEAQVLECFRFTNLQPLWAADNIRKGASWAA